MADSTTYTIRLAGGVANEVFTSITKLRNEVSNLGESLKSGAALLGIGLGLRELIEFGKEAIHAANEMGNLSQEVGIGVEQLSKFKYAADLSDAGEQFRNGLLKLNTAIADSQDKSSKAAQTFALIGVASQDANGKLRPTEEILFDIADRFASWADGANKAAIAQELFGTKNARFISLMSQGSAGLRAQGEELKKIGGALTDEDVRRTEEFERAMKQLKAEMQALARVSALELLPSLTSMIKALSDTGVIGGKTSPVFTVLTESFKYFAIGVVEAYGILQVFGTILGQTAAAGYEVTQGNFSGAKAIVKGLKADLDELQEKRYAAIEELRNPIPKLVGLPERRGVQTEAPSLASNKAAIRDEMDQMREALKLEQDRVSLEKERVRISIDLTAGEKRDRAIELIDQETKFLQQQVELLKQKRDLTTDDSLRDRYDKEIFSLKDKQSGLAKERIGLTDSADPRSVSQSLRATLTQLRQETQEVGRMMSSMVMSIKGAFDSVAGSIGDIILRTRTMGQVWAQAGVQIVNTLTKMVAEYVAGKLAMMAVDAVFTAKNAANAATTTATAIPAGIAQAGAQGGWAGILIYIGVFAAAMAAITALAAGVSGGFESGGYTGDGGTSSPAGIVHGQEYVINAPATSLYGQDFLNALNRRDVRIGSPSETRNARESGSRSQPVSISIINDRQDEREFQAREGWKITVDQMRKRGNKVRM